MPKQEASSHSSGSPLPKVKTPWFRAALLLLIMLVLNAAWAEKEAGLLTHWPALLHLAQDLSSQGLALLLSVCPSHFMAGHGSHGSSTSALVLLPHHMYLVVSLIAESYDPVIVICDLSPITQSFQRNE
uniref:Uncharacterized protein n=1 Tax=Sphaerodactylus townsendi TaxID=933632 RepID=A0ACB8ERW5_9SAUR